MYNVQDSAQPIVYICVKRTHGVEVGGFAKRSLSQNPDCDLKRNFEGKAEHEPSISKIRCSSQLDTLSSGFRSAMDHRQQINPSINLSPGTRL